MTKSELLQQLQETKMATLSHYELSAADLKKTYAPGKWTVRQLLIHLMDAETVLNERVRRAISKPRQVVYGFDQDAWSVALDYHNYPLDLSKNVYNSVRESMLYLVENYYDSHGDNAYVHSETGLRTLRDEIQKVAWHNAHHLAQIEQALLGVL